MNGGGSGWSVRAANKGQAGWPSGSKFRSGAGRVDLAALNLRLWFINRILETLEEPRLLS